MASSGRGLLDEEREKIFKASSTRDQVDDLCDVYLG
jgi:hypothetical protein